MSCSPDVNQSDGLNHKLEPLIKNTHTVVTTHTWLSPSTVKIRWIYDPRFGILSPLVVANLCSSTWRKDGLPNCIGFVKLGRRCNANIHANELTENQIHEQADGILYTAVRAWCPCTLLALGRLYPCRPYPTNGAVAH